jgi:hypothetical protein
MCTLCGTSDWNFSCCICRLQVLEFLTTPAKSPPLSKIVHVPPCTAELALQTRGKAFFLLYVEGGGLYKKWRCDFGFNCARWNMRKACLVHLFAVRYLWFFIRVMRNVASSQTVPLHRWRPFLFILVVMYRPIVGRQLKNWSFILPHTARTHLHFNSLALQDIKSSGLTLCVCVVILNNATLIHLFFKIWKADDI